MKSRECGWAKAVDDKLRMGKGIEEEEEFLPVASRSSKSKEGLWLHHVSGEDVT